MTHLLSFDREISPRDVDRLGTAKNSATAGRMSLPSGACSHTRAKSVTERSGKPAQHLKRLRSAINERQRIDTSAPAVSDLKRSHYLVRALLVHCMACECSSLLAGQACYQQLCKFTLADPALMQACSLLQHSPCPPCCRKRNLD
jgi:hypothetical protein